MSETIGQLAAEACARRIAERTASVISAEDVVLHTSAADLWETRTFPLIVVSIPIEGDAGGESLVLVDPAHARALAALLDPELVAGEGEPEESELEALAALATGLLDGAGDALSQQLATPVALGVASARLAREAAEIRSLEADMIAVSYRLDGEALTIEIVQTLPAALVEQPKDASEVDAPSELEAELEVDDLFPPGAALDDAVLLAVERASAISAEAAAEVLAALFSEELTAATPSVTTGGGETLAALDYPVVVGEVSYLAGLEGALHFVLLPGDAALLAAAMMGTPETTGDGLSAIELSAVSEALNQAMTASARELASTLGVEVEVSPPTCVVVDSLEQARERIGESAYRTSFRFASTVFGAEIVQHLSVELADSLGAAFGSAEQALADGSGSSELGSAFADLILDDAHEVVDPAEGRAGAREILSGIRVRVSAELGRARLPIARVANLPAGSVVMLDRAPNDPVDVLVNGTPFAQAKVVLVDGEYAVQIVSLSPFELTS